MSELLRIAIGALRFDAQVFQNLRDDEDGFRKGLIILLIATLVAGFLPFVFDTVQAMGMTVDEEFAIVEREAVDAFAQVEEAMRMSGAPFPPEIMQLAEANFRMGLGIGRAVAELPTVMPHPVTVFLTQLGEWWSQPFSRLAGWLFYTVLVLVAARLLGGSASLEAMLAATSLFAVPNLLGAFGFIPVLGWFISLVGVVWGWAVYVYATAMANELDLSRALAAVVLPGAILLVLALCGALMAVAGIISLVAAS